MKNNSKKKDFLSILSYLVATQYGIQKRTLLFNFLWWVGTAEKDCVIKNNTTNNYFYYLFSFREVS